MRNDFQIGPKLHHTGARKVWVSGYLSHNVDEYWFHRDGMGGKISKSSVAGKVLTKLIGDNKPQYQIGDIAYRYGLAAMSTAKLILYMEARDKRAYKRGQMDKEAELLPAPSKGET